jgi:hypothetical protein
MRVFCAMLVLGCAATVASQLGRAADDVKKPEERVEAGKCQSASATFVRRESPDKAWQVVRENDKLYTGDLIISGTQGALVSSNGDVRLSAMAAMTGISEFPIIETAVILHEPKDVDLDFTLDRGRVELVNLKKSGAARVRIRVGDHAAVMTLAEPGDRMVDEVYGRWPKGVHFKKNAKPDDGPAIAVLAMALKGEIDIKGTHHEVVLKAPPGPALLVMQNFGDHKTPVPEHMEHVPAWAKEGGRPDDDEKKLAAGKKFRELAIKKSIPEAVDELAKSDSIDEQTLAVFIMGATDDLEKLGKTMQSTKHQEVWDAGVLALHHWIGRCPGQDQKLYDALLEKVKMKPVQAETVMDLLHTYGDDDLAKPETYEMLITYLQSDLLAVRGLAYWHLERLVPEGKKIGYSPLASKDERDKAIHAWQELLPPGKLPAPPKGEGSKGSN